MKFIPTEIDDVVVIEPKIHEDKRGFFMETWNSKTFRDAGITMSFVQDNHSHSTANTLRGLHYQIERPQGKLIRVVTGEIFDVAIDIRESSPTLGAWTAVLLSSTNRRMVWIPPGFAHGFLALSSVADVCYKTTGFYEPSSERTIKWDDHDLNIEWPLATGAPLLSENDANGVDFKHAVFYK